MPACSMKNAGYVFSGAWTWGENIALVSTASPTGYQDEALKLHTNLMNSPSHKTNLLNPAFREVGLGIEIGEYKGSTVAMLTENFAKTGTSLFLLGVAFDDKDGDKFYDVGEALGGADGEDRQRDHRRDHQHHHCGLGRLSDRARRGHL